MSLPRIPHDVLAGLIAVITLPIGILSLFFLSFEIAMVVFVVGWFFLVPVVGILGEEVDFGGGEREEDVAPIDRLRQRYAEGDIDEAEFERRLDALVETEDLGVEDTAAIGRVVDRIGGARERSAELESE